MRYGSLEAWPEINASGYSASYDGGGFGPGYGEDGSGVVVAEQAQQLTIGLEFNDGQWTPSQN